LVSLSAFHLKGSGWYVTDYSGKKPGSETHKPSEEKKTESKKEKKKGSNE
jgi:predicted nucleic acid-binding Zn ribbon protein